MCLFFWAAIVVAQCRVTVLVVYTHCDTAAEYNSSQKQCQEAPWCRDNSLKRKFKQHFNLEFHDVDLKPRGDCYGFDNLKEKIEDRAIKDAATMMDFAIHAVKEVSLALEKETEQPAPVLMQIELVNKPSDFFFKLATYLDAYLLESQHLWRTGAILHFYGNKNVHALIEMPENILSLKIFANTVNSADDQQSFQQLLVINIKETIKSYDSTNISAHSSERIVLVDNEGRGKGKMIRSDVIASLTGDHITLETLKAQLMERGRTMSTITINGNVGDHNRFDNQSGITHINSLGNELIEQLKQLAGELPKTEAKRLDASVIELEKAVKEPDEAKKADCFKKGIELVKDIVAIDKLFGAAGDTLPKIMEGIDAIAKWF